MSLDNVARGIRGEARAHTEDIRQDDQEQTGEIVAEAKADTEELLESWRAGIEQQLRWEREQTLSGTKLETEQARFSARRDMLQRVREQVGYKLVEPEGDRREELTRSLLDATAAEFENADEVSVYGRVDDKELLSSILEDYNGYKFAGERDCPGSIVVERSNSCVRVNNTSDSILNTVWKDNLKEMSARLSDGQ